MFAIHQGFSTDAPGGPPAGASEMCEPDGHAGASAPHIPVLLKEAVESLNIHEKSVAGDLTLGAGGHALEILQKMGPCGRLLGLDRDSGAIAIAAPRLGNDPRVLLRRARFSEFESVVAASTEFLNITMTPGSELPQEGVFDAILLDLGVSSMQIDDAGRGFSFRRDGALDLRMDPSSGRETAASFLATAAEQEIADVIYQFGEERASRRIARAIVEARSRGRIERTLQLAEIVGKAVPFSKADAGRIHPATRTFQALRIFMNSELEELESALASAPGLLKPGGRLAVISYHSLEDRMVKQSFRLAEDRGFIIITKKPVAPTAAEIQRNPRSRSARLRVLERGLTDSRRTKNKYKDMGRRLRGDSSEVTS